MSSDSDLKNTSLGIAITDPISISSIFGNPTMDEINKLLFKDVEDPVNDTGSKDEGNGNAESKTEDDKQKDQSKDGQNVDSQDDKKDTNDKTGCKLDYLLPK